MNLLIDGQKDFNLSNESSTKSVIENTLETISSMIESNYISDSIYLIENDRLYMRTKLVYDSLTKYIKEYNIKNIRITESEIQLLGKSYFSLIVNIKPEKHKEYIEAFRSVIITIKNKLFFIWAIKPDIILKIFKTIMIFEKLPFDK